MPLSSQLRIQSVCIAILVASSLIAPPSAGQEAKAADGKGEASAEDASDETKPKYQTELIRGKVVWYADALKKEFGVSTVPEVAESLLAIHTKDGQLYPIVENLRGRAFRKDERLRGKDMEILARRYDKQPLIQVLRVYQLEDEKRYEVDYWCDVCAIVMYETGPCACCQDHNRLRKREVEGDKGVSSQASGVSE